MSIENAMNRNRKSTERGAEEHGYRLLKHSPEQEAVTKEWVLPFQEEILTDARDLREKVDRKLDKDAQLQKKMRMWEKQYPEGLCREIRDDVLDLMKGEMMNSARPGMKSLREFVRAGGVIKPFWGIDSEKYFQNAIQIGTSILDVANDTVDRSKESVVFYPNAQESPLKNINTFEEFGGISEKYWDRDVYPNIYLPWLAPVFPMISIIPPERNPGGEVALEIETSAVHLFVPNFYTAHNNHMFGLSEHFLTESVYRDKRLSDDMVERLFNSPRVKVLQRIRPDIFEVTTDPEKSLERIQEFHLDKKDPEEGNKVLIDRYWDRGLEIMKYGRRLENRPLVTIPTK